MKVDTRVAAQPAPATGRFAQANQDGRWDVLRLPAVGRLLRWRYSRRLLQLPLLLVSLIMIGHALWGPQLAPKNLGAMLTWVHFRGLVVLVILVAGNAFCLACPFMVPRDLLRGIVTPRWKWPRVLRNKWLSLTLFVMVLFAYELFDLWSNPWWTGILIVVYFAVALGVDLVFQGASFCKFVCPVGQFNFLSATLAPWEVAVRDHAVCGDCRGKECIRGVRRVEHDFPGNDPTRHALPIVQRGCELALFQPRKVGNLDCTFCLDCVYACPHDNVGILARVPGQSLSQHGTRSGMGTLERRADFTALIVVFTFGALLNAFAMISPVYALEQWIATWTGLDVEWPILAAIFAVALVVEPAILLVLAAVTSRKLGGVSERLGALINRFARSLIPIGFGVWLAHYGFHFFTGCLTVVPVVQHTVSQMFGAPWLGTPQWQMGGLPESTVFVIEMGFLGLGLLGSWLVAWRIATDWQRGAATRMCLPWWGLHVALFLAAVWIMRQPMDMRGTFLGA